MKIIMVPGPRNEELIYEIREAKATLSFEEYIEYAKELVDKGEEYFDAMYYACNNRDTMLAEQAEYFRDCLLGDEKYHYATRMTAIDKLVYEYSLFGYISGCFGDKYFCIRRRDDEERDWDYYCVNSDYSVISEGIIDFKDIPLAEVLAEIFSENHVCAEEYEPVSYEELIQRIEEHARVC